MSTFDSTVNAGAAYLVQKVVRRYWKLHYSLSLLQDFCHRIRSEPELAAELEARVEKIESAVLEHVSDGEWYLAGFSDFGNKVGSSENDEGKLYLNSQTWAILTGMAEGDRGEACLKAIDDLLESKHGSFPLPPGYTKER